MLGYPSSGRIALLQRDRELHFGRAVVLDEHDGSLRSDRQLANMATALTILAKQRKDVTFVHQSLHYPVTDAAQDTESYVEFADGPFLTAKSMACF